MNIDILAVKAVKKRDTALLENLLQHFTNAEHLLYLSIGDDKTFDMVMRHSAPSDDTIRSTYHLVNLHAIRRMIPMLKTRCYLDEAIIAATAFFDPMMLIFLSKEYIAPYELMRDKGLMTIQHTNFFVAASIFQNMKLVQPDKAVRSIDNPGPLIRYIFPVTPAFANTCARYREIFSEGNVDSTVDRRLAVLSNNARFFEETSATIDDVAMATIIGSERVVEFFQTNKKTKKWAKMLRNIETATVSDQIPLAMIDAIERCGFKFLVHRLLS